MAIYICSLPNTKRAGRIPELISDNPVAVERFAKKWDQPGRGVFECVSPLREGARRRALQTVADLTQLHVDIDLRKLTNSREEVLAKLQQLPLRLEIRDSGGGFHAVARLKEPVPARTAEYAHLNKLRSRLTRILCGDPLPDHAAALLRRVGTHNSKYEGEPRLVCVLQEAEPVDSIDLEELVELLGNVRLFTPLPKSNGHDHSRKGATRPTPDAVNEYKPPVDIAQRLAAMAYKGAEDSAVHLTQLQVSASMLRAGQGVDATVTEVIAATRHAVANDPAAADWDWQSEQLKVERMCFDFIGKNPELAILLPDKLQTPFKDAEAAGKTPKIVHASHIGWHVRSWDDKTASDTRTEEPAKNGTEGDNSPPGKPHKAKGRGWNYFDNTETTPPRWLIKGLLPETGVGILAGQWGSFKTTAALDLAVSVMTGAAFAGQYRVKRKGAVLYFAVEGAGTLKSRLEAIARYRGAPERLPFAWRGECPALTAKDAGAAIVKCVDEAAVHFEHAYGLPVTLIWIDTYVTAAGLSSSGDDNDVAATQQAFNTLRFVSASTGAFVAVVDHYGKVLEAGTRGSSGKEGSADTVLATLAERDLTGAATSTRMATRKQRDGVSGFELPFTPERVELGLDDDGDPITAIVLDWGTQRSERPQAGRKPRNVALLCQVLVEVVATKGFAFQPDPGAPTVQACHRSDLLATFNDRCHAEGTPKQKRDARRKAYTRAMKAATAAALVGVRDLASGEEIIWAKK